ncbi:MAG: hypothetical protein R3Y50_09240 [Rikenellaceae bacterium]
MRKTICPKCQIPNFYLKSCCSSDILPIYVTKNGEIIPKNRETSLEGYDTESIYCFGCSWSGSVASLVKRG